MIGTIRKHQNWLWYIIIAVVIVSFVIFFSPNATMQMEETPKYELGSINGKEITPRQYGEAQREAALQMFLSYRQWPKQNERLSQMLENSTYQRILIDTKVKELNIQVTPEATARMAKQLFGLEPNQPMPMEEFNRFVQTQLEPNGLTAADFERFVAHQVAQQHLITLFGMNGKLITPQEAKSFYIRENQTIIAQAAVFSYSNYLSQVKVTPAAIGEFYTNNQSAYRLPDRVQVDYVKFDLAKFYPEVDKELAANTNLNTQIEAIYLQRGAEAFKDKEGKAMTTNAAYAEIKRNIRLVNALGKAKKVANDFLTELYNSYSDNKPYNPADFAAFAKSKGYTVQTTEPFDQQNGPKSVESQEFTQTAFRLVDDPSDPSKRSLFSNMPVETEEGLYVLSLKKMIPSQMQPLEVVREQVTTAYTRNEATRMAMMAGAAFASSLTNSAVPTDKAFANACAAQKITPKTLSPFSLMTRTIPEVNDNDFERIQRVASALPAGKASPFIPSEIGGYVILVNERRDVDVAKMTQELPAFTARMRDERQSAAFATWFEKAMKDMDLKRPVRSN